MDFISFVDYGDIEKLKHGVYSKDGEIGKFHHWEFRDGLEIMVCVKI